MRSKDVFDGTMPKGLALALAVGAAAMVPAAPAAADSAVIEALSPRLLFSVSGGYWETIPETGAGAAGAADNDSDASASAENDGDADAAPDERGYYRALAYRSEDNTSRLYLQKIALTEAGPDVVETTEIEAVTEAGAYITDIRPENSTGISATPGFTAFVFLKQDPQAREPETWELFVDDYGEVTIDGATN